MNLASSRTLGEMRAVLLDPASAGPDPVYQVFSNLENPPAGGWVNKTVISAGKIGREFSKTFGHYHGTPLPEIYHEVHGQGVLLLQKKHFENGVWVPEMVDEVFLIKASDGDEITITPEYGHCWSNVGEEELILYDNWHSGHQPADYEMIKKLSGMAYYLTSENGEIKAIPNPNYKSLPEARRVSVAEYKGR
ncbi:hypothetical protein HY086_03600 [Candidatus Gottesmanbacteria bacterium]|nr:hypothetical protein [Candidatus Gottesmanbacteria bacterium]